MEQSRQKAVIVGGSSGIGLALAVLMSQRGWQPVVVDRIPVPDKTQVDSDGWEYIYCDLTCYNEDLFDELAQDESVSCLFITAGIGKVSGFESLHISEVERTLEINTVAVLKVIKQFFSRINTSRTFLTGVMCSIAGHVSSPLFSVYAASKAALCRFIESVNVELIKNGSSNRILDVSPGSIAGTRFYGAQETNADLVLPVASEILETLEARKTLFIPNYEPTYKDVLRRYHEDPCAFGEQSYEYKLASGRASHDSSVRIGYLSGTFDLFHIGHLNLLRRAKQACDYLVVGVHPSGAWKGKETFIPLDERKEILRAITYVDKVIDAPDEDSDAWEEIRYNYLFVGSDYEGTERFQRYEKELGAKGVKIVYFPYTKSTSSTQLRAAIKSQAAQLQIAD